jgi:hypothetical protein
MKARRYAFRSSVLFFLSPSTTPSVYQHLRSISARPNVVSVQTLAGPHRNPRPNAEEFVEIFRSFDLAVGVSGDDAHTTKLSRPRQPPRRPARRESLASQIFWLPRLSRVETGAYTPTLSVAFRLGRAVVRTFSSFVREAEEH